MPEHRPVPLDNDVGAVTEELAEQVAVVTFSGAMASFLSRAVVSTTKLLRKGIADEEAAELEHALDRLLANVGTGEPGALHGPV